MKDRKAVKGGNDINPKDFAFAATLYPEGAAARRQSHGAGDRHAGRRAAAGRR